MYLRVCGSIVLLSLVGASCREKQPVATPAENSAAPHATVLMKDGVRYSGRVTASTPAEVTIAGDDRSIRTFATSEIRSLQYDDTAPAAVPEARIDGERSTARTQPRAENALNPAPARSNNQAFSGDSAHETHYHPAPEQIQTRTFVLPAGTSVPVRTEETIDSKTAAEGQTFAGEITSAVNDADGAVVIPRGSNAQIVIRSASKGGRFHGASDLVLDLASISVGGRRYEVSTTNLSEKGKAGIGGNKRTAEYTGGGALFGAIVGAIAGHGKGAAIGAASGAGAGALTQILTKGGSVKVPVETVLTFRLDRPLHVEQR